MTIEYRTVNGTTVDPNGGLRGMVTPFGVETVIGDLKRGGFKEEIAPGTFTKTLQERAVVLIHNHDTAMPMASTSVPDGEEGHLTLSQERDGFWADTPEPFDTGYSRDVRKVAKILGMSFGFEVTKDDWFDSQGRASNPQVGVKRIIREVKLHEVSTTAFPAYGTTMGTVSARDTVNAARGVEQTRAAVATYADLYVCAECGATDQYGSYCSACGEPMSTSKPSGDFCTSCGQSLEGERDSHVCKETRDDPDGDEYAAMREAIQLISDGRPDDAVTVLQACLPDDNTGAGPTTSVDDDERADMALFAEYNRLMAGF